MSKLEKKVIYYEYDLNLREIRRQLKERTIKDGKQSRKNKQG